MDDLFDLNGATVTSGIILAVLPIQAQFRDQRTLMLRDNSEFFASRWGVATADGIVEVFTLFRINRLAGCPQNGEDIITLDKDDNTLNSPPTYVRSLAG